MRCLTPALLVGLIVAGLAGPALAQSNACTATACGYLPLMIQPEATPHNPADRGTPANTHTNAAASVV